MDDKVIVIPDDEDEARPTSTDTIELVEDDDTAAQLPKAARLQSDGSVALKLRYPVKLVWKKGDTVTTDVFETLTLHRLTGGDMRKLGGLKGVEATVMVLSCSTRIPLSRMNLVFDRMDGADIGAVSEVVGFLSGSSRKTGQSD
jgi:hypothetical protein